MVSLHRFPMPTANFNGARLPVNNCRPRTRTWFLQFRILAGCPLQAPSPTVHHEIGGNEEGSRSDERFYVSMTIVAVQQSGPSQPILYPAGAELPNVILGERRIHALGPFGM